MSKVVVAEHFEFTVDTLRRRSGHGDVNT